MFDFLFNRHKKSKLLSTLKAEILAKKKEPVRLADIPWTLQKDFEVAKFLIEKYPENFRYLPSSIRKDIELSMFAISKAQYNVAYSLCEDEDYLLEVVNRYPLIIIHMQNKIKSPFVLQAVFDIALSSEGKNKRSLGDLIGRLPPEFMDNEYCARKILAINDLNMNLLSLRLQNDKVFLLDYISEKGELYKTLPEQHKKSVKLISSALKTYPQLITMLPPNLQRKLPVEIFNKALNDCYDNQFILNPQKTPSKDPVECISSDVLNKLPIAKTVLTRTISVQSILLRMSDDNRNNKELVNLAVKRNGLELEGASYWLRSDLSVALEAVKQNHEAFKFVTSELTETTDALEQILAVNGLCYRYISERDYSGELLDVAMQSDPAALVYAPIPSRIDTQHHLKYFFCSPTGFDSFMATSLHNDPQMIRNFENALSYEALKHPDKFRRNLHRLNNSHKHYEAEYRGIQWMLQHVDKETLIDFKTDDSYLSELVKSEISRKQILNLSQTSKIEEKVTSVQRKRKTFGKP